MGSTFLAISIPVSMPRFDPCLSFVPSDWLRRLRVAGGFRSPEREFVKFDQRGDVGVGTFSVKLVFTVK